MAKGVEIAFQLNQDSESPQIVEALANLTVSTLSGKFKLDFRVFHVTLGEKKYYRVLFVGEGMNRLHPLHEKAVKETFDSLSKESPKELFSRFNDLKKEGKVKNIPIKEVKEEYDLWEDPIWQYI
ncbi:MAG: hypothetical protein M1315_04365 [Candidatus Thermoplasmatota archaeon]|nr:hypothetical protein [Candidatus Thermoplasmatota archaeon]